MIYNYNIIVENITNHKIIWDILEILAHNSISYQYYRQIYKVKVLNRWFKMCSSGGPMADIDLKKLKTKKYRCKECGNTFKGIGRKVVCPSCQSDNVELAE